MGGKELYVERVLVMAAQGPLSGVQGESSTGPPPSCSE